MIHRSHLVIDTTTNPSTKEKKYPVKTLLQINAGLRGSSSQSSQLADKLAAALLSKAPGTKHIKRDLSKDPIPHLDHGTFQTFFDPDAAVTPTQKVGLSLSDTLIAELKEADTLVFGAPMYNLNVPSTLKSWIDYVSRAGQTFSFTETGPVGLLEGKKAYIVVAQGGKFLGTSADLQTGYLKMVLGLIGIVDVEFIYAQGLAMGPQAAEAGLQIAYRKIRDLSQAAFE